MATIANLNILLSLDDNASGGLKKSQKSLQDWGRSLQTAGAAMTGAVTVPMVAIAAASVMAASDLAESTSAVEQVYESAADTVIQRSIEAAEAVGLSQQEYLSTAAVLGVYGDTLNLTASETADFSNSLITAAADLGSFYNASTPEVLEAMQAALRGEFDPLERFGIMMNQAALEQHALEMGIWDGNGALTAQQRILAAQSFIMDNMGDATGDFARTSSGLANSLKILRAQLKNLMAQMGQVLLPMVTKVVAVFQDWVTRFQQLSPEWQRWIVIIGLAAAAIGPLLIVLGTFLTILPAIGAALAVLTGPIGLVIAAIALLTAAYIGNWWGFRDAVNAVAGAVWDAITALWEIDVVRTTVTSAINSLVNAFDRIFGAVTKVGSALLEGDWKRAIEGIGDLLATPAKHIGDFIKGIETGFEPIDSLLTNVGNMFTDFGRIIQELFQGDFSGALDVFERAINRVPEIVTGAFGLIPWTDIAAAVSSAVEGLPALIVGATSALKQVGIDLLVGVLDGLNQMMPTVTAWLGLLWEVAQFAVGDVSEALYSKGKQLLGGLIFGFNAMLEPFNLVFSSLPAAALAAIGDVTETLSEKGKDLVRGLISGFAAQWAVMYTSLSNFGNVVVRSIGDLSSTLWSTGEDLIRGLINGIRAMADPVLAAVNEIISIIPPAIRSFFGMGSPSRLMMEYGGYIGEGLAIGMQRSLPEVSMASGAMAAAANVRTAFNDGSLSRYGAYGGSGGFVNNGIYNEADRYWAPEQRMRSAAIANRRL